MLADSTSSRVPQPSGAGAAGGRDPRVAAECVRLLYAQATTTFLGNVAAAAVLGILFHDLVSGTALGMWGGTLASIAAARFVLARVFLHRRPVRCEAWGRGYGALSLTVAAFWGATGAWLLPVAERAAAAGHAGAELKLILIVMLLGIAASGVAALHPSLRLARGFLALMLGPPLVCIVSLGGDFHAVLVALGLGFAFIMLRIARGSHDTLCGAIALRFAKGDLVNEVRQAYREGEALNAELAAMRDAAVEASQHKSEFLARMSHEIRTPLNGMLGMLELLQDADLAVNERRFLHTARASGESLLGIINDILDFSRIEAGQVVLDETDFDLRLLVEDIGALFAENAQRKGLELVCGLPAPGPCLFRGDAARLRQILANLVGNAIKFTPEGSVQLRVFLPDADHGRQRVRFEVRDSGIGIEREMHRRVFDAFAQADGSTLRRYGGSGLGLSICRQLAVLMDGEIGVDSAPGLGSCFWLEVSLRAAGAGAPEPDVPLPAGTRVLVAVRSRASRELVAGQLECWGASVVQAADGAGALARVREQPRDGARFDVVLLDRTLDGDGLPAARALALLPGAPAAVMLCPVHSPVPDQECTAAGIVYQIPTPVRSLDLGRCLQALTHGGASVVQVRSQCAPMPRFSGRVLLAEDSAVNQELATAILARLDVEVDVVETGIDAVRAVQRRDYDLVLMDWLMPEMDGVEAALEIRRFEEQSDSGRRVPIVAVTASALQGDEEKCLAAGMDGYLSKPFRRDDLVRVLARWLEPAREHGAGPGIRVVSG